MFDIRQNTTTALRYIEIYLYNTYNNKIMLQYNW